MPSFCVLTYASILSNMLRLFHNLIMKQSYCNLKEFVMKRYLLVGVLAICGMLNVAVASDDFIDVDVKVNDLTKVKKDSDVVQSNSVKIDNNHLKFNTHYADLKAGTYNFKIEQYKKENGEKFKLVNTYDLNLHMNTVSEVSVKYNVPFLEKDGKGGYKIDDDVDAKLILVSIREDENKNKVFDFAALDSFVNFSMVKDSKSELLIPSTQENRFSTIGVKLNNDVNVFDFGNMKYTLKITNPK